MHRQIYPERKKKVKVRRSRPLPRAVHINGKEWRWEYCGGGQVKILSPDNRYHVTPDSVDGSHPVQDFKYNITPQIVKDYICAYML